MQRVVNVVGEKHTGAQTVAFNVQRVVNVVGEKHTGAQPLRHFRLESGTPLCDGIESDIGF